MDAADQKFWAGLDALLASSEVRIDRPRGSVHPRYPETQYPLDYGFLVGTTSADGQGVDLWMGTAASRKLGAVVCCVDGKKREVEVKFLLGCTRDEAETVLRFHNDGAQAATLFWRTESE
jgi:inorganic pyrophosphatase